jgi:phosphatidylglycerophosphate synthase
MQASGVMVSSAETVEGREPRTRQSLLLALGKEVAVAVLLSLAAAVALERLLVRDTAFTWRAVALLIAGGALVAWLAARHLSTPAFGAANRVTLVRAALTLLLVALLGTAPRVGVAWTIVVLATLAAVLDGVDGRLARRRGETSAFGARFDMETDALLILALAGLAWQLGKAGAWVLLAGALRYVFVAPGYALPWLARPLPPSRRRQTVCVIQIVSLIACAAPLFARPASAVMALAGLVTLVGSFALDVGWLARHSRD